MPTGTGLGAVTVGPLGLLSIVEADLGIAPVFTHPSERVSIYRSSLAAGDDLARFYHQSFAIDPVGVAATLLRWRDHWYLHGWTGWFDGPVSARLADMAAVEALAAGDVPPSVGERILRVDRALETQRSRITSVVCLDCEVDLPMAWRRLLRRFDVEFAVPETIEGQAHAGSDLAAVQQLVRHRPVSATLKGDGSLVILRAMSRDVSAQAVAEWLLAEGYRGADEDSVLIAPENGFVLDDALHRVGIPRAGFQNYSPFRAASQVLKLALALIWEPLDPHRLLQFLIHPVSPLSWRVRARLAEAVAAQPGIDGPLWRMALTAVEDERASIEFWLTPDRYPAESGAPTFALTERATRSARWLRGLIEAGEEDGQDVLRAALTQAEALAATLARMGQSGIGRITKIEVDRLVDEVTRALPDTNVRAERGHPPATAHPANITAPFERVIWWDLRPEYLEAIDAWSGSERAQLRAAGVDVADIEKLAATFEREWTRPVLLARSRLVLVVHEDQTARHPLLSRIVEQLSGWVDVSLDEVVLEGNASPIAAIDLPPLPARSLPAPRRWWDVGRPIDRRRMESYSSLAALLFHPHEWVFRYAARFRPSRIADIADGPLLYGSLAHRAFELFFIDHPDWRTVDRPALQHWFDATIDALITHEGAVLLENGRGVDRQRVSTTIERALERLLDHFRAANVVRVFSEHHAEKPFIGGRLQGDVDLVLENASGERAVLDAKWGSEVFRLREIEEGRHLQLATYGYLLTERDRSTANDAWPSPGYYIVITSNVLASDTDFFADALGAMGGVPGPEVIWRAAESAYLWRRSQIDAGVIEINAGALPDDASAPPEDALETRVLPDRFDDFRWLTGVESFK